MRLASLLGALALLLAGAGCGHTVAARQGVLQIVLSEYRLIPQSVRAPAGQLTLYAYNYGRLSHNLAVMRGAQTEGSTQPIPPGHGTWLTLTLTPGKYLMLSTVLSDRDLGIYGTLTVTR